jgi:hypothetical protein
MNETLQFRIAYLNEQGRRLMNFLLPLSDSELIKFSPRPSPHIIYNLKNKALYFSMLYSGEIN